MEAVDDISVFNSAMVKQKQRFGWIYRLTNLIRNKAYIGKTINFKKRMKQHKYSKTNTYLSRSIRKHGWDNFKKEIIIDDVPEEDLSNLETCYIEVENTMFPNGYNLTRGGEGISGYKHTVESREKSRQSQNRRLANRDRFGYVTFDKSSNKYKATGPKPDSKCIGRYYTKDKALEALNQFNKTGERIQSDRTRRRMGTGSIFKNGKGYQARYVKNKKTFTKTFDTVEECEEWLKIEAKQAE